MEKNEGFTSFLCSNCNIEIEASLDMVGEDTECPACGAKIHVPAREQDDNVIRHTANDIPANHTQMLKSRTIRIELDDL